jgi:hypothetical protein
MGDRFHEIVFTDSVRKAQAHYYGKSQRIERAPERDALTEDETAFIQSRDSFYMATRQRNRLALRSTPWRRARISADHQSDLACLR